MSERAPRSSLLLSIEIVAGDSFAATIRNLSTSGAFIKTVAPLQVGDHAVVRRGDVLHDFKVVRLVDGHLGIAFDAPVNVDDFRRSISIAATAPEASERHRRPSLSYVRPTSNAELKKHAAWANPTRHGQFGE